MKPKFEKHSTARKKSFTPLACGLAFMLALSFAFSVHPVMAGVLQATATVTPTITATVSGTPAATSAATATATRTATATPVGTLSAPNAVGSPTALVPVTGADLTRPGGPSNLGLWIAVWLLGMILIGVGVKLKLDRR
jgi:hypothetical protein